MSEGEATPGYAAALAELEQILDQLEDADLDVDVLADRVERAAELIRICRSRIRDAQLKVERIVADLDDEAVVGGEAPGEEAPGDEP